MELWEKVPLLVFTPSGKVLPAKLRGVSTGKRLLDQRRFRGALDFRN